MQKYEVGQPFPDALGHQEGGYIRTLNNGSFDVVNVLSNLKAKEVREFKQGILRIGFYIENSIPFFVVQNKEIEFDCPYNALKIGEDFEKWFEQDSNIITMYLIESTTKILKGIRLISIELDEMKKMKNAMKLQRDEYSSVQEVEIEIDRIYNRYSLFEIIKKTKLTAFVR